MSHKSDAIEIKFNDGRAILQSSTIRAYPDSLLAEKLESLDESTNELRFDRDKRQFALIGKMMVYKERTHSEDIKRADQKELDEDLKFFRLRGLSKYSPPNMRADVNSDIVWYLSSDPIKCFHYSDKPTFVIKLAPDDQRDEILSNNLNRKKYNIIRGLADSGRLRLLLILTNGKIRFGYDRSDLTHAKIDEKLYDFLLVLEQYDPKQNVLVGGLNISRNLISCVQLGHQDDTSKILDYKDANVTV